MDKPLVSIVMPFYNSQRFMRESLNCILNQTYNNWELICINDCSTDDTYEILMEYKYKDHRIHIIQNEIRKGAAESRNIGMRLTKGEYIIFLDSDDLYHNTLISKAITLACEKDAEVVLFDYIHIESSKIKDAYLGIYHSEFFRRHFCKETFNVFDCIPQEICDLPRSTVSRLYRKDFLIDNKIDFQSLPSFNDAFFSAVTLLVAKKIIFLDSDIYLVIARDHNSDQRISSHRNPDCIIEAYLKLKQYINDRCLMDQLKDYYQFLVINDICFICKDQVNELYKRYFFDKVNEYAFKELLPSLNEPESWESQALTIMYDLKQKGYDEINNIYIKIMDGYAQKYGSIFLKVLDDKVPKKNIVIWGYGQNGKFTVSYLLSKNYRIRAIAESNAAMVGQVFDGVRIISLQEIEKNDIVIVSSLKIKESDLVVYKKRGIDFIRIHDYLCPL